MSATAHGDTNCDPDDLGFPIPGNDDSLRSIKLIARVLADAIIGADPDPHAPDPDDGPDLQPSGVPRRPVPQADGTDIALPLPDERSEDSGND